MEMKQANINILVIAKGCSEYNILEMNRAYLTFKGAIWDTLVLIDNASTKNLGMGL